MANKLQYILEVDDKGTAVVKQFARSAKTGSDEIGGKWDFLKNKSASVFSSIKSNIMSVQTVFIGMATGAVAMLVNKFLNAASNLEEMSSKFNVVFRGQRDEAEKWSKTLVDAYAMSTRESKQYLASVQDLLVPMGMAADKAGKMSFEVVKLSADLGSFNNIPTAQVMGDIQSALVGNYETMKKYGVVLNENVVTQKALAMGLVKSKDELTASTKAQAAYQLMVEGSAAAIGDMARTSGGYANQMKQWKALLEEVTSWIGGVLIPTATGFITKINEWIKANQELIKQKIEVWVARVVAVFGTLYDIVSLVWDLFSSVPKGVIGYLGEVETKARKTGDAIKTIKPPEETTWQKFTQFMTKWGWDIISLAAFTGKEVGAAFALLIGDLIDSVKLVGKEFYYLGDLLWSALTLNKKGVIDAWGKIVAGVLNYKDRLKTNWEAFTDTTLKNWNKMSNEMTNSYASTASTAIKNNDKIADSNANINNSIVNSTKQTSEAQLKEREKLGRELELSLMSEKDKAIELMNEKVAAFKKANFGEIEIKKYVEQEKFKIEEKFAAASRKVALERLNDIKKQVANLPKAYEEAGAKAAAGLIGPMDKSRKKQKQITQDMTAAYNQMYGDLKYKTSTYYNFLKDNLKKQAADYARMTRDEAMAAAWLAERIKQLDIEKGKSSNSFFAGVKAGYLEMTNNLYTWGQAGYDMFKTFAGAVSSTFSTVIKDTIAGDLKSFGDYWESFWDSMKTKFADILAQMLTEWLVLQAAMKASQWLGFGTPGTQQSALGVGQQAGVTAGSSALYNALLGGGTAAGTTYALSAGGTTIGTTATTGQIMLAEESAAMTASSTTASSSTSAFGAYAIPIAAAIATQQLIEHGPGWLHQIMGTNFSARGASLIDKLAIDEIIGGGEYGKTYKDKAEFGAPDFLSNPLEIAQYQTDMAREYNEGIDYLNSLRASEGYKIAMAGLLEMGDVDYWRNYRAGLNASIMHDGGVLKAHRGLSMGPDEGLFLGLSEEGVLSRRGMKALGRDNFERLNRGEKPKTSGPSKIEVNFNLTGTVIDRAAVNDFAEKIYPRLKRLEQWGH